MPGNFKLLLFDLGKVILPFDIRLATRAFEKASPLSSEEIVRAVMGTPLDWDFEKGKLSAEAFYEEVKRRISLRMPYDPFVTSWNSIFSENRKVSELVRNLKKRYRIAIISNTNILHFEYTHRTFPIVREIGEFILSYQVGFRKPEPEIFEIALKRYNTTPPETLYIDDRKDFIEEAEGLGFKGLHFTGEEQLKADLTALGLAF